MDSTSSVRNEIIRIRKANAARDPWGVLGIPPRSSFKQIKSAQRRWIRRLHPDRWYAFADETLRSELQEAFYQVQSAYFEALKSCATVDQDPAAATTPIETPMGGPQGSVPERANNWFRRLLAILFRRERSAA